MTVTRLSSMVSAIRVAAASWAGNLRRRGSVLRRWPGLAGEVLLAGLLIWIVFGGVWLLSFLLWLGLVGGVSATPGHRLQRTWRGHYTRHSNLFIQKLAPAGLVLGFILVEAKLEDAFLEVGWLILLPGLAAVWIRSWWSPDLDSRWDVDGRDRARGGTIKGGGAC